MGPAELFDFGIQHSLAGETLVEFFLTQGVIVAQFDFKRIVAERHRKIGDRQAHVPVQSLLVAGQPRCPVQRFEPLENADQILLTRVRELVAVRETDAQVGHVHQSAFVSGRLFFF